MPKVGIVTAMETEVAPLVRKWRRIPHPSPKAGESAGHPDLFESEHAVLACGGIGYAAGKRAAEAVVRYAGPSILIATGLAGGLKPEWTLGRTLVAAEVIDEATGRRFRTAFGEGTVVSSRKIARADKKRELAMRFRADVVDMEGAAVAEVAEARGLPFLAVKAVSDNMEFELPPLQEFVDNAGRFQSSRFAFWAAWHPQWWRTIARLKKVSDLGAERLAEKLREIISVVSAGLGPCSKG